MAQIAKHYCLNCKQSSRTATVNVQSFNRQHQSALSKLKAFIYDNFIEAKMLKFIFDKVENIIGKGQNAIYHTVFKNFFS